jgi:cell division transport system ATP-binding protein
MISFQHVSKIYGQRKALDEISFVVEPGEFVFILGPSGAGKTTLRKLLIKEIEATTGEITIGEFKLSKMKKKENPHLASANWHSFPGLSVATRPYRCRKYCPVA